MAEEDEGGEGATAVNLLTYSASKANSRSEVTKVFEILRSRVVQGAKGVDIIADREENPKCEKLGEDEFALLTVPMVRRYLVATHWHIDKSINGLMKTLTWRTKEEVAAIQAAQVESVLRTGKMYVSPSRDKHGRPILINRKSPDPPGDHHLELRNIVYNMERASRQMDDGVEQWIWILDMKHYSRKSSPPLSITRATMGVFQDHYPERLYRCFILDAPGIFSFLWSMMTPLIDSRTRAKIIFLSGDVAKKRDVLTEYIDEQHLEKDYGGTSDYVYQYEHEPASI